MADFFNIKERSKKIKDYLITRPVYHQAGCKIKRLQDYSFDVTHLTFDGNNKTKE